MKLMSFSAVPTSNPFLYITVCCIWETLQKSKTSQEVPILLLFGRGTTWSRKTTNFWVQISSEPQPGQHWAPGRVKVADGRWLPSELCLFSWKFSVCFILLTQAVWIAVLSKNERLSPKKFKGIKFRAEEKRRFFFFFANLVALSR